MRWVREREREIGSREAYKREILYECINKNVFNKKLFTIIKYYCKF
jgi:hypothetical protein